MSEGSEKLLGVSVGGEGGRGGEEEVSRAEAAFSIKMPTSPHCSSRRRRRRRRRARYVHNVAGPREPHAAAFIRFPVFIAPRPFLPTCTLLPSTDPISVPTVTVFSLPFFFSILLPPSNIAHVGAEGETGPWSLFIGDVHGHLDAFLGEILNSLASLPSLFVFVVFILFLFFSFYFFGLCSSDLTKKRERKGSFEVSFFSFFFLDSREDGSLSLSRLGEKEDFWIRGNSWESGIWLNLMGEFGSFGDFSYRFRGILVNRDRDLKKYCVLCFFSLRRK